MESAPAVVLTHVVTEIKRSSFIISSLLVILRVISIESGINFSKVILQVGTRTFMMQKPIVMDWAKSYPFRLAQNSCKKWYQLLQMKVSL